MPIAWLVVFVVLLAAGLSPARAPAASAEAGKRPVERRLAASHSGMGSSNLPAADVSDERPVDQSVELHRPSGSGGALVIFVDSRFWRDRLPESLLKNGFVKGVVDAGHSVAVVRPRLVPGGKHPVAIQDVARAVASLLDRVEAGEFDPNRVFLAGHSSGAQLALLLALDETWLRRERTRPARFAGVLSLSGILDLSVNARRSDEEEAFYAEAFPDPVLRVAASPMMHVNQDVPAILLMNAGNDIPGYARDSIRFAEKARAAGQPAIEYFVANGRDHFSILDLATPGGPSHVFDLLESDPRGGVLPELWETAATWREPPFTTEDLFTDFGFLVRDYAADSHFTEAMNRPFRLGPTTPDRLRVARYQAIDLVELLAAMGPERIGQGAWLVITNARGEKAYFSLDRLRELAPRLVIGLDGERNLFRATDVYHTRRRYSWVDAASSRIDMARPLGAFLFFPGDEPPRSESSPLLGRYALTSASFRLHPSDPLAPLADLPDLPKRALVGQHNCISCHRFRDVGGRAFHLRARDGVAMGGHALPLERYPAVVWKRFIFDQRAVADEVGANAVDFSPATARALYHLIVRERAERGLEPWIHPDRDRD